MARGYQWVRILKPGEKKAIGAACQKLIDETLKPAYLPEVRPRAGRNYAVDLRGRWRGDAYSFVVRFRSGFPENEGEEYDAPFARLEHWNGSFAVDWMRHTGRWWRLREGLSFDEALAMITDEPALRPPV
jgi:hypothetical protein